MVVQELVLNSLVHNLDYFGKVLPHLKASYFDSEPSRIIFGIIEEFAQQYNSKPTPEVIAVMAQDMKIPEGVWDGVVDMVGGIENPLPAQSFDWMIQQTQTWMRDRAAHNVIMDSVDIYSNPKRREELKEIPTRMEEALVVGFDDDLGEIYWEMAAEQYDYIHATSTKIPFKIEILNKVTKGGVLRKTLCAINAGINVGKTTALIDLAAQYAEQGLNVVYFTFEVASGMIRHRMDCRILDRDFDAVEGMARHEYIASIEAKYKTGTYGQIFVKEFASGSAHTGHCRAYVKDLMKRRNIEVDVMMFDYIGEMASERLPAHMMSNTNIYYGSIAREIRTLAFQFNTANWTALQFNREKQNSKDMSMTDQADSINIPKILDFQLGLAVPDEYANLDQAFATVMKNRFANKAKLKSFLIGLNNDKQRLYDVDSKLQTFAAGELNQGPLPDSGKVAAGESIAGAPRTGVRTHSTGNLTSNPLKNI